MCYTLLFLPIDVFVSDPVMVSLSQDIFRELSKNEQCLQALQSRLVPTLLSILNQDPQKLPGGNCILQICI